MINKYLNYLQEQEEVLNEISPKVKLGLAVSPYIAGGITIAGISIAVLISRLKEKKMQADGDYKKCIQNVENTIGKNYHQMNKKFDDNLGTTTHSFNKKLDDLEDTYEKALNNCKILYKKKIEMLKKQKEELKKKIKQAKERNSKK